MAETAVMGSPENPPMGKLADFPAWLARNFPALTGPIRSAGNAAALPASVAADLLSRGAHGVMGLNRPADENYSGARLDALLKSMGDTVAPLRNAAGTVVDKARETMMARGATSSEPAGAFAGNPAARTVSEGVPSGGPVQVPPARMARASVPAQGPAEPQGGAFVRTGGAGSMNGVNVPPPTETATSQTTAPAQADPVQGAFAPPAKSLAEEFKKRSAEMNRDPDGKLTKEQKANAELNFFLGLMAKSARPGARMLGAFGESGQEALKGAGEQQEKNLARGDKKLQGQRDDLYREMGFADKDEDNRRGDRRAATEEKRFAAADKRDQEKLDLQRKQFDRDGTKVVGEKVLANGNIGFMTADKKVIDSGVKAKGREPTANETALSMLTKGGVNTSDALDRIFPPKPKNNVIVVDEEMGVDEMTGKPITVKRPFDLTTNEYLRPSNAAPSGQLKFKTPQELEAAIKSGKVKKGDKVMTPAGEKVVR